MADHHHHHQPEDHQVNMELPPGFRFHPTDEEIITHYLREKVLDSSFAAAAIADADFNKCEPWDLPKKAKMGEKEWYFFSQRDRKYPTGMRTNRATQTGYWKATGKDKEIYTNNNKATTGRCLVGMKKTLVFYTGRAPKGHKSNWVMHEFRLIGSHNFSSHHFNYNNLPKDEWVVCRVFHKNSNNNNNMIKKPISPPILTVEDMLEYSSSSLPPLADVVSSPNNNYATTTILSSTTTTNSHHHHHHHHHMFHNNNNNNMMASTSTSTADFSQSMCQPHQDTINAEISSSMPSDHHGLFDLSYWDDYYLLSN